MIIYHNPAAQSICTEDGYDHGEISIKQAKRNGVKPVFAQALAEYFSTNSEKREFINDVTDKFSSQICVDCEKPRKACKCWN